LQVISDDNNNNSRREKLAISRLTTPVEFAFMSIRSPTTKKQYPRRLKQFFDFIGGLSGDTVEEQALAFLAQAKREPEYWVEDSILLFVNHQKDRVLITKEIAAGTLYNFYQPIAIFCKRHKHSLPPIDWDMLSESLPQAKRAANDRVPTVEEIKKLVEYPDRAIKPIVYTMCSSGIRLGAWDYLKWKHVTPIKNEKGEILAAKLKVYAEEPDEYFSFITSEAYNSLKEWMDYRDSYGETITGDSWIMRDKWPTVDKPRGLSGIAKYPQKLGAEAIKKRLLRALEGQGIRQALRDGKRCHEWKGSHGFRKWFKTRCENAGMKSIIVEFLLGHSLGITDSYFKPTEQEVFDEYYLKAVPALTINDYDQTALKKQVAELTEKSEEANYVIKGKLAEKEKEAEETKKELKDVREEISLLKRGFNHLIETGVMEPILRQSADTDR
jgi:integrase